jgi:hypothetical protein
MAGTGADLTRVRSYPGKKRHLCSAAQSGTETTGLSATGWGGGQATFGENT